MKPLAWAAGMAALAMADRICNGHLCDAYNNDHLVADYQFGIYKNTRWSYETLDDVATMNTAGYFSAANNTTNKRRVQIGDEILATVWTTALPAGGHPVETDVIAARALLVVVQVDDDTGVIDVSNGDSRTLTDSD
mgnify:CR=1 FL=1